MRITTRSIILELLRANPEGLSVLKLTEMVQQRKACVPAAISVAISQMKEEGSVIDGGESRCCECGRRTKLYRASRAAGK